MNNFFNIPTPPQVFPPLLPGVTPAQAAMPSITNVPAASAVSTPSFGASLLSALPTLVSTGLSAFTQFQGYKMATSFARFQERQFQFQARAAELEARQKAIELRKEAIKHASAARALFASSGIRGQGTAAKAIQKSFEEAQQGVEASQIKAELKAAGLEFQGASAGIGARLAGVNRLLNISSTIQQGLTSAFPLS